MNDFDQFQFTAVDEYTELLTELHQAYHQDEPSDVLQYCANFFNQKLQEQRADFFRDRIGKYKCNTSWLKKGRLIPHVEIEHHPLAEYGSTYPSDNQQEEEDEDEFLDAYEDDEEERDNFSTLPLAMSPQQQNYNRNRRVSVSAESMAPSSNGFIKKVVAKTPDERENIKKSVGTNFLFKSLDEEHHGDVVDAMISMCVQKGHAIIEQGGVGDFFYVVQSGTFDCYIDTKSNKVASYEAGGSFGELALMYNAPRAATIVATSDATLWALDRITFRTILMENTSTKRKLYESFLEEVPLLKSLESYERHKIADALESVYYNDGEHVILQGDVGDQFYIIESGAAVFYKVDANGDQQEVNESGRGAYFGELALINDSPRAATVIAKGRLKCATLGKKAFIRLLGSVHEILKRNSENYHAILHGQLS